VNHIRLPVHDDPHVVDENDASNDADDTLHQKAPANTLDFDVLSSIPVISQEKDFAVGADFSESVDFSILPHLSVCKKTSDSIFQQESSVSFDIKPLRARCNRSEGNENYKDSIESNENMISCSGNSNIQSASSNEDELSSLISRAQELEKSIFNIENRIENRSLILDLREEYETKTEDNNPLSLSDKDELLAQSSKFEVIKCDSITECVLGDAAVDGADSASSSSAPLLPAPNSETATNTAATTNDDDEDDDDDDDDDDSAAAIPVSDPVVLEEPFEFVDENLNRCPIEQAVAALAALNENGIVNGDVDMIGNLNGNGNANENLNANANANANANNVAAAPIEFSLEWLFYSFALNFTCVVVFEVIPVLIGRGK